jgi:hypothetical protein
MEISNTKIFLCGCIVAGIVMLWMYGTKDACPIHVRRPDKSNTALMQRSSFMPFSVLRTPFPYCNPLEFNDNDIVNFPPGSAWPERTKFMLCIPRQYYQA